MMKTSFRILNSCYLVGDLEIIKNTLNAGSVDLIAFVTHKEEQKGTMIAFRDSSDAFSWRTIPSSLATSF